MTPLAAIGIALGGFVGAICRALVGRSIHSDSFPLATLFINASGSAFFGFLLHLPPATPGWLRTLLLSGFCGAFTTFSTFILEAIILLRSHQPRRAVAYLAWTIVLSLAGSACGFGLGSFLSRL